MTPLIPALSVMTMPEREFAPHSNHTLEPDQGDVTIYSSREMGTPDAAFRTDHPSPVLDNLEKWDESMAGAKRDLNEQLDSFSSRRMSVADALRFYRGLNDHDEAVALYKGVSDSLVQGVQTLARG
jgi:hypothetical protein